MAGIIEHRIDIPSGTAVDWVLSPEEAKGLQEGASRQREAQQKAERRAQALKRLRFWAVTDRTIADILTVLGLDE